MLFFALHAQQLLSTAFHAPFVWLFVLTAKNAEVVLGWALNGE